MRITVIDTETTGLDLSRHEIIQIGVVQLQQEDFGDIKSLAEYEYNIRPYNIKAASAEALKINGYTEERWKRSVSFKDVFNPLNYIWENSDLLLGQNLIFDLRFIAKYYKRYGINKPKFPRYIDTKHMGSELVNEGVMKSSSMDSMCKHFNIKFKGRAHTALTDCQRTVTLWRQLGKYAEAKKFSYEEPYDPHAKANSNARKSQ